MPPMIQNNPSVAIHLPAEHNIAASPRNARRGAKSVACCAAALSIAGAALVTLGLTSILTHRNTKNYLGFPAVTMGSIALGTGLCTALGGCCLALESAHLEFPQPTFSQLAVQVNSPATPRPNAAL